MDIVERLRNYSIGKDGSMIWSYIEEAADEITRLRKEAKWLDINEHEPPVGEVILIFGEMFGEIYGSDGDNYMTTATYEGNGSYDVEVTEYYFISAKPTHWKPINPPKDD